MELAKNCAKSLLSIKAIKLSPNQPFTWASGLKSPIYCDNRKTLSYPEIRGQIRDGLASLVKKYYPEVQVIAGVATGAIAQGVLVAQELGIPFVYVRSAEKKHGLENKVEGVVNKGDKVVVIEDLVSTGQSSLDAVETLRAMGCNVLGMVAIFTYNLPISVQRFQEANVELHTLTNYNILVPEAAAEGYVKESDIEVLNAWSKNPALWSEQHQ
ncbi:MAG: orotate phosphoribosyltransferase [Bacteroidales bacterium]|jgi:orotate phosphoribosyltransferase|nr:orotate phosphoribosyltransferase [Bacteroidales bacterium]MBO7346716.1 orotate phosphoribosyltransferase [Bacteroidales bacterium]MBQ4478444.1 orotate phosphoribosyltransferase [Bacteroidales bacterium]MBR4454072.1 orotate phosphoribosyltransferase [Bacteroidales bacterium]MCR5554343.1 orotate phosphoribosyltransferase [Bacteroidales bacterium]